VFSDCAQAKARTSVDLKGLLASEDLLNRRLAEGLDWIQRTIGENVVDDRIAAQAKLRGTTMPEMFDTISPGATSDLFGWHLYNCYAYCFDQPNYDTNAGCRIVPTMVSLGARVSVLETIPGACERLVEVAGGRADFEKTLFEVLVAASYGEAGWNPELLKAGGAGKTPDIRATVAGGDVFIECKRMSKNSGYHETERERWYVLARPLVNFIERTLAPVLIDIVFHRELSVMPDDSLATTLVPKLSLAVPGVIIDSPEMTVTLREVDMGPLQRELQTVNIKANGSRILFLLFGQYSPELGYRTVLGAHMDEHHPLFLESVEFAAGITWFCDAPRAIAGRARDVRRRLWDAIEQLPDASPGIVHIAVESYDGPVVERLRNQKITRSLRGLRHKKDLRLVHVHLVSFETPPDESWAVEETVFSTSFAHGTGATAAEHENSPYRLKRHHVWSVDGTFSQFTAFRGFS
jgi:hypothetical protein